MQENISKKIQKSCPKMGRDNRDYTNAYEYAVERIDIFEFMTVDEIKEHLLREVSDWDNLKDLSNSQKKLVDGIFDKIKEKGIPDRKLKTIRIGGKDTLIRHRTKQLTLHDVDYSYVRGHVRTNKRTGKKSQIEGYYKKKKKKVRI